MSGPQATLSLLVRVLKPLAGKLEIEKLNFQVLRRTWRLGRRVWVRSKTSRNTGRDHHVVTSFSPFGFFRMTSNTEGCR
jgi:hypothetical protein